LKAYFIILIALLVFAFILNGFEQTIETIVTALLIALVVRVVLEHAE